MIPFRTRPIYVPNHMRFLDPNPRKWGKFTGSVFYYEDFRAQSFPIRFANPNKWGFVPGTFGKFKNEENEFSFPFFNEKIHLASVRTRRRFHPPQGALDFPVQGKNNPYKKVAKCALKVTKTRDGNGCRARTIYCSDPDPFCKYGFEFGSNVSNCFISLWWNNNLFKIL